MNVRCLPLCSQKQPEPPAEVPTDLPLTPSALESLEAKTPETPTTPGGTRKTVTFNLEQNQTTTIESSTAHKRQQSPKTKRKTLGQVKRVRQLARLGWFFSTSTSSSTPYHPLKLSMPLTVFNISLAFALSFNSVSVFLASQTILGHFIFHWPHFLSAKNCTHLLILLLTLHSKCYLTLQPLSQPLSILLCLIYLFFIFCINHSFHWYCSTWFFINCLPFPKSIPLKINVLNGHILN